MPAAFNKCVKAGGRVRTQSLSKGRYRRMCFLKGNSYAGHIQKRKSNKYSSALGGK